MAHRVCLLEAAAPMPFATALTRVSLLLCSEFPEEPKKTSKKQQKSAPAADADSDEEMPDAAPAKGSGTATPAADDEGPKVSHTCLAASSAAAQSDSFAPPLRLQILSKKEKEKLKKEKEKVSNALARSAAAESD